jgi:ADP-ribose pyrophosphatase YjhB (NUDIX family)
MNVNKEEENKKMFKEVTCPKCGHPVYVYRNPLLTVDCIIEKDDKVLLINRENHPLGYALPGGYVDYGESVEQAVIREIKEETNLDIVKPKLFGVYSDPERDPRGHTVTIVFHVKTTETPIADDDAKDLGFFDLDNLPEPIAFDHVKILKDYIEFRESQNLEEDEEEEYNEDEDEEEEKYNEDEEEEYNEDEDEEEKYNEDEEEDIDTLREAIYEKMDKIDEETEETVSKLYYNIDTFKMDYEKLLHQLDELKSESDKDILSSKLKEIKNEFEDITEGIEAYLNSCDF